MKQNRPGRCKPCNSKDGNLCCKQVLDTTSFRSSQTGTSLLPEEVNHKNSNVICILECIKCLKQYVGKSAAQLNLRVNNNRKDS